MIRIFAFLMFMFACGPVSAQTPNDITVETRILDHARARYIAPAYARLEGATQDLNAKIAALCAAPGPSQLADARRAFLETARAWAWIEWFRIGPVMRDNRVERFFFFPDRKSIALRQVQAALAQEEPHALELEQLQNMSVALQGFNALDYLLSGNGSQTLATQENSFRCRFAQTVSHNLAAIAHGLHQSWQADAQLIADWRRPHDDNPFFRTEREAMNTIISTLAHGLEAIRDTRINVFLRAPPDAPDRPRSAPLWRSQATMATIAASLQGLEQLFTQSQIETILPENLRYLGDTIRFEFAQSVQAAQSLDMPVADIVNDAELRDRAEYLRLTIGFLIERFNRDFAPAAGLSAGFSFGDGD